MEYMLQYASSRAATPVRAFDNIVVVLDGALCWMVRVRESEALDSRWYYYPALIDVLNKLETAIDLALRSVGKQEDEARRR